MGALVFLAGGACGPIEYMTHVSRRATVALAQAKEQGAERFAPYEYTAATEYLRKAREEAGEASYQVAIGYGKRAEELAGKAEGIARRAAAASEQAPPPSPAPQSGGR